MNNKNLNLNKFGKGLKENVVSNMDKVEQAIKASDVCMHLNPIVDQIGGVVRYESAEVPTGKVVKRTYNLFGSKMEVEFDEMKCGACGMKFLSARGDSKVFYETMKSSFELVSDLFPSEIIARSMTETFLDQQDNQLQIGEDFIRYYASTAGDTMRLTRGHQYKALLSMASLYEDILKHTGTGMSAITSGIPLSALRTSEVSGLDLSDRKISVSTFKEPLFKGNNTFYGDNRGGAQVGGMFSPRGTENKPTGSMASSGLKKLK